MTLADVITTYVIDLLKETQITSASPGWTNTVKDVRVTGLGADFEYALQEAITETISEIATTNPDLFVGGGTATTAKKITEKKGTKERQTARLVRQGVSIADNPAILVAEGIRYLPHATLLLLALSLAPLIFDILTKPGGVLDLRFKRIIDNEINAFLSRQTQKDTEFGVRQVIIQSKIGFTATNGANNFNTVRGIREGGIDKERLDRIGMIDHSKGVFDFG